MRLLVPVDFSDITNPLLRTVKRVKEKISSEIHLLHVIPPIVYLPYPETMGVSVIDIETLERIEEEKRREAEEKLHALKDFLGKESVYTHVELGDPADTILEYEDRIKPDLVFLGGHKKSLVEKILIGSTTEKVVKHGKVSDFVIKGSEVEFNKSVVIAYDFSETSQKAVEFSLKFLKPFGVNVKIIHVEEPFNLPVVDTLKKKFEEKFREEKKKLLQELKDRFEREGLKTEVIYTEGKNPVDEIAGYVNGDEEVELLIIGSKGLSGLKRIILGNTATKLLGKLNKPVLIYKVNE
ncbi:universal stress protein [Aquifex pyrophilus]